MRGFRQEHTLLNTPSAAGLSRLSKCLSSLANVSREERDVRCRAQRKTRASDPSTFAHFHLPKTPRGRAFFASERVAATTECIEGVQRRVADRGRGGARGGDEGDERTRRDAFHRWSAIHPVVFTMGFTSLRKRARGSEGWAGGRRGGGRGEYTPISERFIIETARRGGESEGSIAFFFSSFFFPFRGRNPDAYVFVA